MSARLMTSNNDRKLFQGKKPLLFFYPCCLNTGLKLCHNPLLVIIIIAIAYFAFSVT